VSATLPLPLRWYSAITANQSPEGVESAANLLSSTYELADALTPDYVVAMLSILFKEYPIEIPMPGCYLYRPPMRAAILLAPLNDTHASYMESRSDLLMGGVGDDLLRWFLFYQWFSTMLPRMVFGAEGEEYRIEAVAKYSMVYADVASELLDNDEIDLLKASMIAPAMALEWDDDFPAPPWDLPA
jgi:hypothetical protein